MKPHKKLTKSEAGTLGGKAGRAILAQTRQALIERRKTALLMSRGLAVAAAGGGATTDPLTARARFYNYAAFNSRFTTSTAVVGGTALSSPTF